MAANGSPERDLMLYGNAFWDVSEAGVERIPATEMEVEIAGGSAVANDEFIMGALPRFTGPHRVVCDRCGFVGYRKRKFNRACPVKKCSGMLRLKAK